MAIAEVPTTLPPNPHMVIEQVASDHHITVRDLQEGGSRCVTAARADACRRLYELRMASGDRYLSLTDIARLLHMRDHTSVRHWVNGGGKNKYR